MTIAWALLQLRHHTRLLAAAAALGACTVFASIGLMSTSGYLISKAALRPPILELMIAIVAVRFFGLSRAAVRYSERIVSHDLTFRLLLRLRCWLYGKLAPIVPSRSISHHCGDLLTRLVSDVETMQNLYLRVASPAIVAGITAAVAAGLLSLSNPMAAIILLSGLAIYGVALPLTVRYLARETARQQVAVRAAMQRHLVDSLAGLEELTTLGIKEQRQEECEQLTSELSRMQRRQATIGSVRNFLSCLLLWFSVIGVLGISIVKVRTGGFDGLILAAVAFGVLASFEAVQALPQAFQYLDQAKEASRRLYDIVGREAPLADAGDPSRVPQRPSFSFRNVSFAFPGASRWALNRVSFEVPFGSKLAIVGPSGSGKSTMVHMLCRFFDPQNGEVLLETNSLRKYSIHDVRAQLAVVLQHPHIFNTSIRENLLLAKPAATDQELTAVLQKVGLASLIQALPDGLDAMTGSEGLMLSGGERQRLALAQAFLKEAPVLVLDEATANLDPKTEREILDSVYQFTIDRTLIMITHRLEILSGMDAVLTIRDGKLSPAGSNDEIIQRSRG